MLRYSFPFLETPEAESKRVSCICQNLNQLDLASQMYATDNLGRLVQNVDQSPKGGTPYGPPIMLANTNAWVYGDMKLLADATNATEVTSGLLYPYA